LHRLILLLFSVKVFNPSDVLFLMSIKNYNTKKSFVVSYVLIANKIFMIKSIFVQKVMYFRMILQKKEE